MENITDVLEDFEYNIFVPKDTGRLNAISEGEYLAGAKNAHVCSNKSIFGDVFLDKIVVLEKRQWKPNLKNILNHETIKSEETFNVYYLKNVELNHDSKLIFAEGINTKMNEKYKKKIALNDIDAIFSKVNEKYNQLKTDSEKKQILGHLCSILCKRCKK